MNNINPGDAKDVLAVLQEQLEARSRVTVAIESTVLIAIDIAALLGNSLLCLIVSRNSRLHSSTTMLIVALAITDLLTATTVMPLTIEAIINSKRGFSDTICKEHVFAMAVLAQVSIYLMALTAFIGMCASKGETFTGRFSAKSALSSSLSQCGLSHCWSMFFPTPCLWMTSSFAQGTCYVGGEWWNPKLSTLSTPGSMAPSSSRTWWSLCATGRCSEPWRSTMLPLHQIWIKAATVTVRKAAALKRCP